MKSNTVDKSYLKVKGIRIPYYPKVMKGYEESPRLNITDAIDNLNLFTEIANKYQLPVILIYGTLLGAIRNNSFIKHDVDIDLTIDIKYEKMLLNMVIELESVDLLLVRYKRFTLFNKGIIVYAFERKDIHIDVFIMQKGFNSYIILGKKYPKENFEYFEKILFYDNYYFVPHNSKLLLSLIYGDNWETPIPDVYTSSIDFIWQIKLLKFFEKDHIKYNFENMFNRCVKSKIRKIIPIKLYISIKRFYYLLFFNKKINE